MPTNNANTIRPKENEVLEELDLTRLWLLTATDVDDDEEDEDDY